MHARLETNPEKLRSLGELERTGGEPDVVGRDDTSDAYIVHECSTESPAGRRSFCYDHQALEARKKHKPGNSAVQMDSGFPIDASRTDVG